MNLFQWLKKAPLLSAVFPNDAPILARYPETSLYQLSDYSSSVVGRQLNQCVRWFYTVLHNLAGGVIWSLRVLWPHEKT